MNGNGLYSDALKAPQTLLSQEQNSIGDFLELQKEIKELNNYINIEKPSLPSNTSKYS